MRTFLVALLALVVAPSLADAAGTKGSALLKVTNRGSDILAVIVDPSSDVLDSETLDAATFFAAGGRIIGPRGATVFALKAGDHTVVAAYVRGLSSSSDVSATNETTVTTTKGQTVNVTATGNVDSGVTFK
jgi:hypothetical protein